MSTDRAPAGIVVDCAGGARMTAPGSNRVAVGDLDEPLGASDASASEGPP
jgi:hypothetical protein